MDANSQYTRKFFIIIVFNQIQKDFCHRHCASLTWMFERSPTVSVCRGLTIGLSLLVLLTPERKVSGFAGKSFAPKINVSFAADNLPN